MNGLEACVANTRCSKRSRVESAPKVVQFTTVKATKDAIIREDGRIIRVKLSPGDVGVPLTHRLAILIFRSALLLLESMDSLS